MSEVAVLFSILGAFLLGAMSPGPSFIVVSRIAVAGTRTDAMLAALGMGVGGFVFALIAVAGLTALLMQVEWLNLTIRLAGGAYLFWLGVRIWRGASDPVDMPMQARRAGTPASARSCARFSCSCPIRRPRFSMPLCSLPSCPPQRRPGCSMLCRPCSSSSNSAGTRWSASPFPRGVRAQPMCIPNDGSTAPAGAVVGGAGLEADGRQREDPS